MSEPSSTRSAIKELYACVSFTAEDDKVCCPEEQIALKVRQSRATRLATFQVLQLLAWLCAVD